MAKTKALISFAVTAKLICVFVFAYAKIRFSHDEAHTSSGFPNKSDTNHSARQYRLVTGMKLNTCVIPFLQRATNVLISLSGNKADLCIFCADVRNTGFLMAKLKMKS